MKTQPEPGPPGENVPPTLAAFLVQRRDFITKRWIEAVRRNDTLKAAKEIDDEELADHLPKLFDDLATTLRGGAVAAEAKRDAEAHGLHRWQQRYELEEVLEELGIVSRILLAHGLDAFADEHPGTPKEQLRGGRERILRFFEDAAAGSVRQYVQRTSQQLREQDLALSEQRRLALDSAQMGSWHFDLASGRVHWDERLKAIFGVADEELSFERVMDLFHPADRERVRAAIDAASRPVDPVPYCIEYRVVHPDSSEHWVQAHGKTYFAGEGEARHATSLVGTVRDITGEKSAGAALRQSEEKYRTLFDSIDEAFCVLEMIWDAEGQPLDYRFVEVNRAMERHTGWKDPVGRTARELIPNLESHWPEIYGRVARTGEPTRFTQGAEGMGRVFDVYAFRIGSAEHPQVGLIFQDITERRRTEAELVSLSEQRQLALDAERVARAETERISRVKDEFLATLSHELRTPLNAILGWTQVLRGDPANSEDMEAGLATIERNSRAQTQIIEDLLDMSKIISGKVRLDVQTLHLDQVVTAAVETMRPAATAKGIRLQALIDPEARMISGDPNRLQQVFWNLLSNAIKFTPKDGKVQVILERIHSHLEVCVADTGEGIAAEFLPFVFDRFRQQDASTTRRHGGLGLGLAIVKQLVELHGGSISAKSAGASQGTTFCVKLPLSVVQPAPDSAAPDHRHPQSGSVPLPIPVERLNLAGLKVLVVDDEADARALVQRLLQDRGARVQSAGSAAEAVGLIQSQRPDVLVSDIGMPGEDGYALIRQVRALAPEQGGNTPAIALTAYARSEDRLKVILAGFQIHMAKPVEAAELLALVASLAGRVALQ